MPIFIPPDYIDNSPERGRLGAVLNRLITEYGQNSEAHFASGYFEPRVWAMVGAALQQVQQFRLMLGREPQPDYQNSEVIDLRKYYAQKLKGNLESLEFNREHLRLIEELISFLQRDSVAVRLYRNAFLHAKAYIFPNVAIVGSSNFTPSGLSNNSELDLVSKSDAVARSLLTEWYNPKWEQAQDYKAELIQVLEKSKFGSKQWTPYDIFIKVLYEYFHERIAPDDLMAERSGGSGLDLAVFQQEGLHEAIRLLDLHGGVMVADAVGLGKTFIGLGLLEHYLIHQRKRGNIPHGLVVCPAQLKNTVWEPKLREYQIAATVISMEEMGRQDFEWRAYRNFDFVLVDESHNFRNPGTGRYRNLQKLVSGGKRNKLVALLTATPINNTVWDLYNQLMLITKGQESHYREWGIGNLRGFFARVAKSEAELFNLLEETMVRRSRQDIRRRQQAGEKVVINGREIRFPERKLAAINYDLDGTYAGFYSEIAADIEKLNLVSYNIEQFRVKGAAQENTLNRNNALIGILKTLFLKRLESSVAAFETSVRWQIQFQRRFYEMLIKKNKLLDSSSYRKLTALLGGGDIFEDDELEPSDYLAELGVEPVSRAARPDNVVQLLEDLPSAPAKDYDLEALKVSLEKDLAIFEQIINRLDQIRQSSDTFGLRDDKLEQVKAALVSPELRGRKVLIFSYYERTANYLYMSLLSDAEWQAQSGNPRLGLLTGRDSPATRKELIRRFAPIANADPLLQEEGLGSTALGSNNEAEVTEDNEIDILISTDVLSEGQNLQDAGILLNYDLHWNPVRMIQRAGRIDRVGSSHSELLIYNCFPEAELEQLLGLVGRLQQRIADIGRNIGNDASILGELVTEKSLEELKRLKAGDRQILVELEEQESELLSADEMRLPLVAFLQQLGESALEDVPLGIHSGRGNQPLRGVFFVFRARNRHFWRFYEIEKGLIKGNPAITDKRRLFRMLQCDRSEARVVPKHEIWSHLETATKDILAEIRQQEGSRRLRMPMTGQNLRLYNLITPVRSQLVAQQPDLEPIVTQVLTLLQEVALKPFERDPALRQLWENYQQTSDIAVLINDLDAFATEHQLYEGLSTNYTSTRQTFENITANDLELICYELFT